MHQIHPVVLAGGSGIRLWPLSRPCHPKPFLSLAGENTLFQLTVARLADAGRFAAPLVICSKVHRFLVAEQLHKAGGRPSRVVLEPTPRSTAPAACVAALLLAEQDPNSLLMLLPSDHFIGNEEGFALAIDRAARAAADGWIVTFGARPDRPETGYGYIQQGESLDANGDSFRVERFVEKPDLATAESYVERGDFLWNSGMFLLSAGRLLEETGRYEPEILKACEVALQKSTADEDFLRLDEKAFAQQPNLSFDRAVMERTGRGAVVPVDIGWSDVGCWEALYQLACKDEDGNVLRGDATAVDCRNSYLNSQSVAVVGFGLEDIIVVSAPDVLLICPRDRSQDISRLVDRIKADARLAGLATASITGEKKVSGGSSTK